MRDIYTAPTAAAAESRFAEFSAQWSETYPAMGRTSLRARATDAAGNVQPEVPIWNKLGYGNNAIELSYVDVR